MATAAFFREWQQGGVGALALEGHEGRAALYDYLEAWYRGTVLLSDYPYRTYLTETYRLYRHTRLLWNPIPNVVNFWAGIIYPGNLSEDGKPFEDNRQTAIPFGEGTKPELMAAIAQVWTWGNWQSRKSVWTRSGAMMGNALLEIRDLTDARKVYLDPAKPQHVARVDLNPAGDVLFYALEYMARESDSPSAREYRYRKEVDRAQIRTYRDDKPWSYEGVPDVVDHPYGFCPAVWVAHRASGPVFGEGAILSPIGTLGQLAELNSLQSHVDDQVHKSVDTTWLVATDGSIEPLFNKGKRGKTEEGDDTQRESVRAFKVAQGTTVTELSGALNISEAREWVQDGKEDFKGHYPEYTMYVKLREMNEVAGVAAEILLGDIANPVREVRANYDRQLIKACQMAISIAAMRAKGSGEGSWQGPGKPPLDDARKKFATFSPESYAKGELAFDIADRPLVPDPPLDEPTKVEVLVKKVKDLEVPVEQAWEEMNYDETKRKKWAADKEARRAEMQDALGAAPGTPPLPPGQQPGQPGQPPTAPVQPGQPRRGQ